MSLVNICDICKCPMPNYPVYGFRKKFKLFRRDPGYDVFNPSSEQKTDLDFCDNCFKKFVDFVNKETKEK